MSTVRTVAISNITLGQSITSVKIYHTTVAPGNQVGITSTRPTGVYAATEIQPGSVIYVDIPDTATTVIIADNGGLCGTQHSVTVGEYVATPTPTLTPTQYSITIGTPTTVSREAACAIITPGAPYTLAYTGTFGNGTVISGYTATTTRYVKILAGNEPGFSHVGKVFVLAPQLGGGTTVYYLEACNVPTPTPTSTPTPTLTTTPICYEFDVANQYSQGGPNGYVDYTDCNGNFNTITVLPDFNTTICARTILTYNNVTITNLGVCP